MIRLFVLAVVVMLVIPGCNALATIWTSDSDVVSQIGLTIVLVAFIGVLCAPLAVVWRNP